VSGRVSRRSFLGNIATVAIATTAGPLLQVGESSTHQATTTETTEAATPSGTVPVALKINGETRRLQIEPRVTLLDGAHFCEIAWDPGIARLKVSRWLTVIDGGRMINLKTSRNQILGGVVIGIGMAMLEETIYDQRNAKPINNNYADYLVPVNADIPEMDCIFLDFPDTKLNEYGARGIGEIGLTGCASAFTNAVFHATGVRIRELPVRIEKLLKTS